MHDLPPNFLERTATLDEVLGPEFMTVAPGEGAYELDDTFWTRWKYLVANGDENRFLRRLAWAGWDTESCSCRLQGFRRIPDLPPPGWSIRAQALLKLLTRSVPPPSKSTKDAQDADTPFIELIAPVLADAQNSLRHLLLSGGFPIGQAQELSDRATTPLRQALVDLLGPILFSLFKQHSHHFDSVKSGNNNYLAFVLRMQLSGYRQLFEARPVLLRMLVKVQDQWLTSMHEFLLRLRDDMAMVSELVLEHPGRYELGDVKDFEFGLSDPHNEGRSVIVVVLGDRQKFLYKPKDLRPEANLIGLLTVLHHGDSDVDLRVPRCLTKSGYGWMEFIENLACDDRKQVESYYRRTGAWLALFHVLGGSDIHDENLIACGEHPVPVDFEVLFQGGVGVEHAEDAFHLAREKIRRTVLAVGMLPTFGRDHNKLSFEFGGLKEGKSITKTLVWRDLNTDSMTLDIEEVGRFQRANLPRLGEVIQEARDFQKIIVYGFESCMNLILKLRESAALAQALAGFKALSFRKVYRPTYFYYMMLERLRDFSSWRNGLAWSVEAEFLFRLVDWDSPSARKLPTIAKAEKRALLELNIPHFIEKADGTNENAADGVDFSSNDIGGFTLACTRLLTLSPLDIEREAHLIRLTLSQSTSSQDAKQKEIRTRIGGLDSPLKIAEFVMGQAIRHKGTAAWFGLDWHADLGKSQLVVLGQDFYNGNGGIAIFLAAAAKLLKRADLAHLVYEAIAPIRKSVNSAGGGILSQGNEIGGGIGLTSHVYVLTTLSDLLEDKELLDDAGRLVQRINNDLISRDKSFDVLAGSAGAILALLKYYQSRQDNRSLEMAIVCGEHLLSQKESWQEMVASPQQHSNIQANGFAHGSAGISLALFRLAQTSGRMAYREAAHKLVHFENSSFSSTARNWPDLRFRHLPDSTWACQWCHGAGGIGLARLCAAETLRFEGSADGAIHLLLKDVEHALEGVSSINWPGPLDSLCCGNVGNTEFIREVGARLGRPELILEANIMLEAVINRFRKEGDYAWSTGDAKFNIGLFRGLSGLGYAMLRAAHPGALPNVLIWE
jgi:type 2 lantibiotic biosynthesis protein LanM